MNIYDFESLNDKENEEHSGSFSMNKFENNDSPYIKNHTGDF
jgi:hypothetical protein